MTTLSQSKKTAHVVSAWGILMALTAASWWLGADHRIADLGQHVAAISILVLTFGKIAVVGHSFMELREAAPWLQRAFFGWCTATCAVLAAMYLVM